MRSYRKTYLHMFIDWYKALVEPWIYLVSTFMWIIQSTKRNVVIQLAVHKSSFIRACVQSIIFVDCRTMACLRSELCTRGAMNQYYPQFSSIVFSSWSSEARVDNFIDLLLQCSVHCYRFPFVRKSIEPLCRGFTFYRWWWIRFRLIWCQFNSRRD